MQALLFLTWLDLLCHVGSGISLLPSAVIDSLSGSLACEWKGYMTLLPIS